jgi:hypothetical protein
MKYKFNINNSVEVRLTEKGANIYNNWYGRYAQYGIVQEPVQEGHLLRAQLWHLFQVFGEHIHLGGEVPFEMCNMYIDEKDLEEEGRTVKGRA